MEELLEILYTIERPGDFCASGTIDPCFPGLDIENVGTIGFPLTEYQAKEIIRQCSKAPFGRGEQTVVDSKVRSTWMLEPNQFLFKNPQWDRHVKGVVETVKEQFGLSNSTISHELYKCLLYEKDDFFSIHRDTEKTENMFATLVIVMPSEHKGGELIVYHEGEEKKFSFGKKSPLLKNLQSWAKEKSSAKPPYEKLLKYCTVELQNASSVIIEEPKDWAQNIKLTCKCADCRELQVFLKDTEAKVHNFRVKKERRQHLHNIISRHAPDMTHITTRKGSPYTLVCTKTRDTYRKKLKQREIDRSLLEELNNM